MPPLIMSRALTKLVGIERERIAPIEDFFTSPAVTIMKHYQILIKIQILNSQLHTARAFLKQMRDGGLNWLLEGQRW